jgi:hypothetical protein
MEAEVALILSNIQAASAGLVPILYTLLIATFLDVLSGTWAAWVSGTFESKFFLEFIKSHIITKVAPILLILLAGVSIGGTDSVGGIALVTTGGGLVVAYLGTVVAGIRNNVNEGRAGTKGVPTGVAPVTTTVDIHTPTSDAVVEPEPLVPDQPAPASVPPTDTV